MGKSYKKFWKLGKKEFNTQIFDINKDDELIIREGNYQYNVFDLIKRFGSPMEIFMPFILEERLNHLFDIFSKRIKETKYRGKFYYHYPMKVNQNKEAVLPLVSEGAHLEVGSANELTLVKRLWESDSMHTKIRVLCNGPKTKAYVDLIFAMQEKGLRIVPIIEDLEELNLFKEFKGDLGIRINLETKVKSHWDKKFDRFGLSVDEIIELGKIRNLKILHYHIGSQIERGADIISAIKDAFKYYQKLALIHPSLDTIDIGGGFAVPYEKKSMYEIEGLSRSIINTLKKLSEKAELPHPNLIVEWGRYIVAPAQITVFKVVSGKKVPNKNRRWYVIDGSFMNDLLDTWALHQKWHIVPINHLSANKRNLVWLAGLSCDSDDAYTAGGGYILLPRLDDLDPGEDLFIATLDTGAYQDALASHHCLLSSPVKIVLQNGIVTIARKRESPEEIGKLFGW
ncbi:hypothetical protein HYW53_00500 [Candidatus Giovannonibacteria bacterium]|nr:hypothetical protein [Candidatus Giovannonibacteria bacterium]